MINSNQEEVNRSNRAEWGVGLPFSPGVQNFVKALVKIEWATQARTLVFVRDYEQLPYSSPFDVDAMIAPEDLPNCRDIFHRIAGKLGLVCIAKSTSMGVNILILELSDTPEYRTWVYFEIVTQRQVAKNIVIHAVDVEIERSTFLPIPTTNWRFAINLIQALRKNDLERYRGVLDECLLLKPECASLMARMFDVSTKTITSILTSETGLPFFQTKLGIQIKQSKPSNVDLAWHIRIRRTLEQAFYLIPLRSINLITVHGADGVGKTTACDFVQRMFAGYPINSRSFHHVTSWKTKDHSPRQTTLPYKPHLKISGRHLLQLCYRNGPQFIRDWWLALNGYHRYGKNLNMEIFKGYIKQNIMVLDRYIYDMYLKQIILHTPGLMVRFIGLMACKLMRRPLQAVLIVDRPAKIIERKQELSLQDIECYQVSMEKLLRKLRISYTVINVGGREPQFIGKELGRVIIDTIGVDLLRLMKHTVNPTQSK